MENTEVKVLVVTEEEFEKAVHAEMDKIVDEKGKEGGMGALLFAMGGATFCHSVWNRLVNEKKEEAKE